MLTSTDVFVIGGGPAGLAAAIAARKRGLRVIVADGTQPPIDKACGEGLMPDGLDALQALGLQLPLPESYPFGGIRFLSAGLSAEASFPASECGRAIRRLVLHRFMIECAEQAGVEFLWRTPVTGISLTSVHLGKSMVRSRWIVGADGTHSRVRRWARLAKSSCAGVRYAFRQHYRVAPWTDHMEVYWADRCQGYAVGVSAEQVCVAVASHDPNLRLEQGLRHLPRLRERLAPCEPVSTERGAITGNSRLGRVCRGNVALIGDAAGTVDAITGEGLGLAFRQAVALANCLESGNLAPYQHAHRRLMLRPLIMARLMLALDGRPRLQHRTLQLFQKCPQIFRRLLALHVGALPPRQLLCGASSLGSGC